MFSEKICPKCKKWNKTQYLYCIKCGEELFKKERLQNESLKSKPDPFKIPLIKISSDDGYIVVFGKKIIQIIQLIFFGLISFLIWIGSIMPG